MAELRSKGVGGAQDCGLVCNALDRIDPASIPAGRRALFLKQLAHAAERSHSGG